MPSFSSGCPVKMKTMCSFETSETTHPMSQWSIPEDLDPRQSHVWSYEVSQLQHCWFLYNVYAKYQSYRMCQHKFRERKLTPFSCCLAMRHGFISVLVHEVIVGMWCIVSATRVIGQFFWWDRKLTPMCYTNCDTILITCLIIRKPCLFTTRQRNISYRKQFYAWYRKYHRWENTKQGTVASTFARYKHVCLLLLGHVKE